MSIRPDHLIIRAFLFRGVRIWFAIRGALALLLLWMEQEPLALDPGAVFGIVLLTIGVGFIGIRRHHERALLGNLAISPLVIGALIAGPAVLGEVVIGMMGPIF